MIVVPTENYMRLSLPKTLSFADAQTTLQASPWLAPMASEVGGARVRRDPRILTKNAALGQSRRR